MNKRFLVTLVFTLAFAGLLSLVACGDNDDTNLANRYNLYNRGSDNTTYNRGYFDYKEDDDDTTYRGYYDYKDVDDLTYRGYYDKYGSYDKDGYRRYGFNTENSRKNSNLNSQDRTDSHYDFVTELGFKNVVNPNGYTYQERYRLDKTSASDNNIFHGWLHSWAEPRRYVNKDIDIYRYTGDYNGESRNIYIKSYNGEVLGGYHFGPDETVENAQMIKYKGYSSRLSDDFRGTWDGLFDI